MSVPLAAGTYWLDITQAATTQSGAGYWDVNTLTLNGPYTAYLGGAPLEFDLGYGDEQSGQFAGTFALSLDGGQSVPEPAVAIGLCTTLAGLGFVSLRQRKAKA
jgi:hypothetical protein